MSQVSRLVFAASIGATALSATSIARNASVVHLFKGPIAVVNQGGTAVSVQSRGNLSTPAVGLEVLAGRQYPSEAGTENATGLIVRARSDTPFGTTANATGLDVYAEAFTPDTFGNAIGIRASGIGSDCAEGIGVDGFGAAWPSTAPWCGIGVRGPVFAFSTHTFGVYSDGDFAATGMKAFLQPHPTDPSRAIRFAALEGNECGTYFRGTAELVGGTAELPIPESWRLASEAEGITVQLTAVGANLGLYVGEQSRERIVVRGEKDGVFHFQVNGVRRGFADMEDLIENRYFLPRVRGVPFGTQYPPALREVLVQNGILNGDGTPNENTARALGWSLIDPQDVAPHERWWLDPTERRQLMESEDAERAGTLRGR